MKAGLGIEITEEMNPVLSGTFAVQDVTLLDEHELFSIYRPNLIPAVKGMAVIGVVPVTGFVSVGLGLSLVTKKVLLNTAFQIDQYKPFENPIPQNVKAGADVTSGLDLSASAMAYVGGGLGIPGFGAGLELAAGVEASLDADLGAGVSFETDGEEVTGFFDINLGLGLDVSLSAEPMLYVEALDKHDFPTDLKPEATFPEIFSYEWSARYPWGGGSQEGAGAGEPDLARKEHRSKDTTNADPGIDPRQPTAKTPLLDKHKGTGKKGEVKDGPKMPDPKEEAEKSPAGGVEGLSDIGANEQFEEAQQWLALAGHAKQLWDVIGEFLKTEEEISSSVGWLLDWLPGWSYGVTALYYVYKHFVTEEFDLDQDFIDPIQQAWNLAEDLELADRIGELVSYGIEELKEALGDDPAKAIGAALAEMESAIKGMAKENWHPLIEAIFERVKESVAGIVAIIDILDGDGVTLDRLEAIADMLDFSTLEIAHLSGAAAWALSVEGWDFFSDLIMRGQTVSSAVDDTIAWVTGDLAGGTATWSAQQELDYESRRQEGVDAAKKSRAQFEELPADVQAAIMELPGKERRAAVKEAHQQMMAGEDISVRSTDDADMT